ncbi:MAG TPA: DUF742 domain-containing protein [Micromonosporaceae bacterium]
MRSNNDPRGALVRPYAVTRGRTEPRQDIAIEAVLLTSPRGQQEAAFFGRDKQIIANLCDGRAQSLAEISAHTQLPLGVARVLVGDMVADGLLALHEPLFEQNDDDRMELLERVLSGLRRL